ncbi:MAG TPA: SDR family oxidoreductase [Steroidobacteraceae bacterium]|nr:SDR family oxidoreductase [Steroidobacteraceae bacterium]
MNDLKNKVAVVLGASAENGTGWAIARALAQAGAKVVVAARSFDRLQALAEKIGALPVACDAGSEADVAALARTAKERFGKVDIAVNSAGLPVVSFISEVTQQQLDDGVRVNYFANVYFTKYMAEAIGRDGSIILITSMSTTHPVIPHFAYACAKAATDCLARYAAIEYGPRNIRVNTILPGSIRSDLAAEAYKVPGFEDAFKREIPLGRVGEPDDFANAVLWLAGPAYVTGLNLQVNGGNHLTRFPSPQDLNTIVEAYKTGKPLYDRG